MTSDSRASSSNSSSSSSSTSSTSSHVNHSTSSNKEIPHVASIEVTQQDDTCNNVDTIHHDEWKVFVSRIPQTFNEDSITRILCEVFGDGSVSDASLVYVKEENEAQTKDSETKEHRGFGFVTFSSKEVCDEAIARGTVRGSAKSSSKRKHTLYIQRVVREDGNEDATTESFTDKNLCYLWKKFRCPYGDECKFLHEGEGGCATNEAKVQKCFSFKRRGKCKLGDKCPFSHDVSTKQGTDVIETINTDKDKLSNDKASKHCINWKTKGKCRKGDKCPYRHDESVRLKALSKKDKTNDTDGLSKTKQKLKERENKVKQSLSIRVFGLNYSTTKEDVQNFFIHCGKIVEISFPTYEDSGRSKGYCGILFASPKAVQKAVEEMNGSELHGRWLSVQEGKMFLRKWEEDERVRRGGGVRYGDAAVEEEPLTGEFGQKVKKRKKHGYAE